MTVSDLMRTDVVTVTPDTQASEVARQMRDENVGSVIVEEGDRPVGIITDRDLAVGPYAGGGAPDERTAGDVMTADLETIPVETGVMELCGELREVGVRRMPVVDEDDTLAGIITLDDLHVLLASEQRRLADVVAREMPPY